MNKPYENQMPSGVDSFVEEASKEEVKAPEQPMQQKFTSKDYGNVRVYPNETGSDMDKNNKWIGKRYSLMEAHNLNDDYLKNNLVGKTKSGADIYKMPDGYFSGNPRINDASFKDIQDLEDFEKKSGEHRASMKEGTYLDDYIKNYNQPKPSAQPKNKLSDAFNNSGLPQYAHRDVNSFSKEDIKAIKKQIEKNDQYYESNWKGNPQRDALVKVVNDYAETYRNPSLYIDSKPKVEGLTDEELKEELVDNKYYYENARNEEEVAKWLAERQDIPYDRALAFVKANYKDGAIWNEEKTYEQFDKYENDIRAKAKEISDSMKAIGYYNLGNKDQLEQAYQDLAYDLKKEFPMVDPKEIEEYVAEEAINLY